VSGTVAKVGLAASLALLFAAGTLWIFGDNREPRSDLMGRQVASAKVFPRGPSTQRFDALLSASGSILSAPTRPPVPLPGPSEMLPPPQAPVQQKVGKPIRITIPALDVDAPVVPVGLQPDGSMEVPDAAEGGWFHPGVRPGGESGSAVIAGHVDHAKAPGVFLELRKLGVGDQIELLDDVGKKYRYAVTERFQIDKDKLPAEELFRRNGPPTLTLITCGGAFNRKERSYQDNIVIRATPLPEPSPTLRPF
jgi:LPXTG-site transpeptidase (sortase) family protein